MAYIDTIPPNEAEGATRDMYLRQQGAYGFVPNYAKVFCYRPEIMTRWAKLIAEIRRPQDLRRYELATLAAAAALKSSYCSLAHGSQLRQWFGEDTIADIAEDRYGDELSDAEVEMMRFARQVALDASVIQQADVERLKSHGFSDADVFDVVVTAAGRAFLTKISDALGAQPDPSYLDLDENFRLALTVGAPIDGAEVEVLDAEPA